MKVGKAKNDKMTLGLMRNNILGRNSPASSTNKVARMVFTSSTMKSLSSEMVCSQ